MIDYDFEENGQLIIIDEDGTEHRPDVSELMEINDDTVMYLNDKYYWRGEIKQLCYEYLNSL